MRSAPCRLSKERNVTVSNFSFLTLPPFASCEAFSVTKSKSNPEDIISCLIFSGSSATRLIASCRTLVLKRSFISTIPIFFIQESVVASFTSVIPAFLRVIISFAISGLNSPLAFDNAEPTENSKISAISFGEILGFVLNLPLSFVYLLIP